MIIFFSYFIPATFYFESQITEVKILQTQMSFCYNYYSYLYEIFSYKHNF